MGGVPLLGMLKEKMTWLGARQKVLAENVAHGDTPGYRAQDLERPDFTKVLNRERGAGMATAQPGHFTGTSGRGQLDHRATQRESWHASPDGNTVSVEQEMMKVSETVGEYRMAANLYAKSIGLLKTAIGGR